MWDDVCSASGLRRVSAEGTNSERTYTYVFNYIQCTIQYDKHYSVYGRSAGAGVTRQEVNILTIIYINALYITNSRTRTTLAKQHNIQRNRSTLSIRYKKLTRKSQFAMSTMCAWMRICLPRATPPPPPPRRTVAGRGWCCYSAD